MQLRRPFSLEYLGGTADYITVETYADLPDPVASNGQLAYVETTTGAWNPLTTTREAGWYRSNGTAWVDTTSDIDIELWVSGQTYTLTECALGSDGNIYRSLISSNTGNNPVTTTGFWEKITQTEGDIIPLVIALG